jgi:hypothetical protein
MSYRSGDSQPTGIEDTKFAGVCGRERGKFCLY